MGRGALRATDLVALVAKAYESALSPRPYADFLPEIAGALDADAAILALFAPEQGFGDMPVAHGVPDETQNKYREHYWSIDPWRIETQRRRIKRAATGTELVPFKEFVRTEIYTDLVGPGGFFDCCSGVISATGSAGAAISVLRRRGRPFFARREARRLDRVLPHLARAFALHRRFAGLIAERTTLADIIDRFHGGSILCDRHGRVVYATGRGREALGQGGVLYLARGKLRARDPKADSAMTRIFGGNGRRTEPPPQTVAIAARGAVGGAAFHLSIVRAIPGTVLDPRSADVAFYVLIDDHEEIRRDPVEGLARKHRLTPAEARLARCLAAGATLRAASEEIGVSVNTVRSQLQQIFQKTGVSRQSELMRLLLSAR